MADLPVDVSHYSYRVTWSPEDREFVATCVEFPSLSWLDSSRELALTGVEQLVTEVAQEMHEAGESLPAPLAERPYSGKFQVRVSQDLHRRLSYTAAEQGVSLNRYVEERLAQSV